MSTAIIPVAPDDELAVSAPPPNAAFQNRIIHPTNLAIEQRRAAAQPLKPREVKQHANRLREINERFTEIGFDAMFVHYKHAYARLAETASQHANEIEPEKKQELSLQLEIAKTEVARLRTQIGPYIELERERRQLNAMLLDHAAAVERQELHKRLAIEMAKEVRKYEEILIEHWSRMGFQHVVFQGKKHVTHRVRFEEIQPTPDAIYYKIKVTRKVLFGFKPALPQGVYAQKLVAPETLTELTAACQRQVTGKITQNNGVWVIVNRLNAQDGLLEYVTLEQLLRNYPETNRPLLPLPIGVGEARQITWINLTQHPHILIGGSTGGGKSNIIRAIICTLIQMHSPDEVQFILVDLKEGTEFRPFESIPHLLQKPVTELEDLANMLNQLAQLRRNRGEQMAAVYARDIDVYNARMPKRMPRIVVIVDEYAAIQEDRSLEKVIQGLVMQITARGRSAGIHLILATQNPSIDILPGASKANMAFRLAAPMPTKSASMTILGKGDAAMLPDIPGRMMAMCGAQTWMVQTPHVRESDYKWAMKAAGEWEGAPVVELPEAHGNFRFTDELLIELMLNEFDGVTATKRILKLVKEDYDISFPQLSKQMKRLIDKKELTFQGQQYKFIRAGSGYKLVPVEPVEQPETREPESE